MKNLIVILIAFALMGLSANAQTNVSGGIYSNTTWTLNNSPYIVTDTVVVFPNVTLTIEAGVVVKFDNAMRIEIRQAQLIANGTSTDSITFTSNSNSPTMGIYPGIFLNGGSMTSSFNFCNIRFASIGINSTILDTILVNNSIFDQDSTGIKFITMNNSFAQVVIVDSSNFSNNNYGLDLEDLRHATINYCNFSNNRTGYILGNTNFNPSEYFTATTNFCNFSNNGTGFLMDMDTSNVTNCNFTNNHIGFEGGSDQAVFNFHYINFMNTCMFDNNDTALAPSCMRVENCTVFNNPTGLLGGRNTILNCAINMSNIIGIYCWADSVANSNISNNGLGIKIGSSAEIIGNTIENNTNGNIEASGSGGFFITGNSIKNSIFGIDDSTANIGTNSITQNIIENNNLGIRVASASNINCNLICNNTTYDLKYEGTSNIDASHNYWCTTDSVSTRAKIYDGYTNINYGLVLITPFDTNGCNITTGISSPSASNSGITVFPNPATTILNIHINSQLSTLNSQLIITDLLGNEVFKETLPSIVNYQLSIGNWSAGLYFYEVRGNNTSARGKFIKEL